MLKHESALDVSVLKHLIRLDEETGSLYWLARPPEFFIAAGNFTPATKAKLWNGRYAGKQAFTAKHRGVYFVGAINGVNFFAHRVVFALYTGDWPQHYIDHIDGNGFNNTPSNLRDVQHRENMRNVKLHVDSSTGFLGVSFSTVMRKFEARISVGGRARIIGYFDTADAANQARIDANKSHGYHENHGRKAA